MLRSRESRDQPLPVGRVTGAGSDHLGTFAAPVSGMRALTGREDQIIRLVARGLTTKAIAVTLSIAESTVNWHVGNALAKLGAASRAEAVAIVLHEGPIDGPIVVVRASEPHARLRLAIAAGLALAIALTGGTALAALRPADRAPERPASSRAPVASATPDPGATAPVPDAHGTESPQPTALPTTQPMAPAEPRVSPPKVAPPAVVTPPPAPLLAPLPATPAPLPALPLLLPAAPALPGGLTQP